MALEIINNIQMPRAYWAAGAFYLTKGVDKSYEFFMNSIWTDGYAAQGDMQNGMILDQIKPKDVLILKSTGVKNKKESFTRLKAIGIVIERKTQSTFSVKWHKGLKFPVDFNGILYMKTIQEMREDALLRYSKDFLIKLKLIQE